MGKVKLNAEFSCDLVHVFLGFYLLFRHYFHAADETCFFVLTEHYFTKLAFAHLLADYEIRFAESSLTVGISFFRKRSCL
jgi:hypothetical protein